VTLSASAVRRPPLPGYNHNIRYKGRVYHVQTEDSGVERPHVITHMFLDGMIVATLRSDYRHLVAEANHVVRVRHMMQEQHKAIMKGLRRGELDGQIAMLSKGPPLPPPSDLDETERYRLSRGQRISQQISELTRSSGVIPVELPEFGAIRLVDLSEGDDEELLELDLEAIAQLDFDPPAPTRTGDEPGDELDLDALDNPELTPRPSTDLADLMRVQVTPSASQPRVRVRTPSLPNLPPPKPVDERVFRNGEDPDDEGLTWEPSDPRRRKP